MKEIIQKNDHILEISNSSITIINFKQIDFHIKVPFKQEKEGHFKLVFSRIEDE